MGRIGALFCFLLVLFGSQLRAGTITVCNSCMVKTIKEGIAVAVDYDTLLIKKGIYKESPIFFKNIVSKVGKRTKNSRTVPKEERKEIQIFLTDFYNDMYINCFYSFVANDSNLDVNDVFYSRTYFFVDFLDLILKNEKLFLNFNPNLN